jgi:ABC-type tungstate transport system substrate-binding protein
MRSALKWKTISNYIASILYLLFLAAIVVALVGALLFFARIQTSLISASFSVLPTPGSLPSTLVGALLFLLIYRPV